MFRLTKLTPVIVCLLHLFLAVKLQSTVFEPWFMVKHLTPNVSSIELKNNSGVIFKSNLPTHFDSSSMKTSHSSKEIQMHPLLPMHLGSTPKSFYFNSKELITPPPLSFDPAQISALYSSQESQPIPPTPSPLSWKPSIIPPPQMKIKDQKSFQNLVSALSLFMGYRAAQQQQQQSNHIDRVDDISESQDSVGKWFREFMTMSALGDQFPIPSISQEVDNEENLVQERYSQLYKSGGDFLSANPYVQMYVTSHLDRENSFVNLTSFRDKVPNKNRTGGSTTPTTKYYKILCEDANNIPSKFNSRALKMCQNIIGTGGLPGTNANGHGLRDSIVFDLKGGNDVGIGRVGYKNIYYVNKGHKFYKGQDRPDTFILMESGVRGMLDGGPDSDNSLVLAQTFDLANPVTLKFNKEGGQILQSDGFTALTRSVQLIYGREVAAEKIYIDNYSDVKVVDGQGGKSSREPDLIEIFDNFQIKMENLNNQKLYRKQVQFCEESNRSFQNVNIKVNSFTKIENFATQGNFTYNFHQNKTQNYELAIHSLFKQPFDPRGNHRIILNWDFSKISSMTYQKNSTILTINSASMNFTLSTPVVQLNCSNSGPTQQPTIYTMQEDGMTVESEIRVDSSGQLHVVRHVHKSIQSSGLGDLTDNIIQGFGTAKNIFNIHNGHWFINGGGSADIFNMYEGNFSGILDGGLGSNSLVLDPTFRNEIKVMEINLMGNFMAYVDDTFHPPKVVTIMLKNINRIIGRPNATELITIDCTTTHVDGRGGLIENDATRKLPDIIKVLPNPAQQCHHYKTEMLIHPGTVVQNFAQRGEFIYKILKLGAFDVDTNFPRGTTHNYILPYNFETIHTAIFDRQSSRLRFKYDIASRHLFDQSHWLKFSNADVYHVAPQISSKDGILFRVHRQTGNIMAFADFGEKSTEFWNEGFQGMDGIQHTIIVTHVAGAKKLVQIVGGDQDDIFILASTIAEIPMRRRRDVEGASGFIDGQGGNNVLELDSTFLSSHALNINLLRGRIFAVGPVSTFKNLKITNIASVQGRPGGNDTIVVDCYTKKVSGLGGHDLIIVPRELAMSCDRNLTENGDEDDIRMEFVIETFPVMTRVINFASHGHFTYKIHGVASFDVETENGVGEMVGVEHLYKLSFDSSEIEKAWFEAEVSGGNEGKFALKVKKKVAKFSIWVDSRAPFGEYCNTKPKIVTKDGLCLSVNSKSRVIVRN